MAEPPFQPTAEPIEVVPVVVLSQVFPARPSSIPDIRGFVRRCLAESPLTEEGTREVGETVFRALLDAAGPTGSINVAFRIFPEHVEVDVLHSDTPLTSMYPASSPAGQVGRAEATSVPPGGPASLRPVMTGAPAGAFGPAGAPAGAFGPGGAAAGAPGTGEPEIGMASGRGPAGQGADPRVPVPDLSPDGPVTLGGPGHPATFAEWMSSALRREGLTQQAAARQLGVSVKTISRWVGGATEPRMRDLPRIQELFGELQLGRPSH